MNDYWENRYKSGGNSGPGSYNESATFKATTINNYINKLNIKTISDYGCGDGNQIGLLSDYELYHGYDVSNFIIDKNVATFANKNNMFFYKNINDLPDSDLNMSLDVIYHLSEFSDYVDYLIRLFNKSKKYVLIFSTDEDREYTNDHFCSRKFTVWIEKNISDFELVEVIEGGSGVNFYLYEKITKNNN